jgi:uncharacterized membrane protein
MAIELRVFKAQSGLEWFKAAWQIFKSQPGTFIFMHLFIIIVALISIFIFPFALAAPFLIAGFYGAIISKLENKKIMLIDILKPFSEKGNRLSLFRLGLYQMAFSLILNAISQSLLPDLMLIIKQNEATPELAAEQFMGALEPIHLMLCIILYTLYNMAFSFAVPLIYFKKKQNIFEVIKVSLMAYWQNFAALGVFGGILTMLFMISFLLYSIPLLIVMPISYIAFFIAYQAIFQLDEDSKNQSNDEPPSSHGQFDA